MAEYPRKITTTGEVGLRSATGLLSLRGAGTGTVTLTADGDAELDVGALAGLGNPAVAAEAGTSVALTAAHSDLGGRRYTSCTAATAVTITIPTYAATPIPVGALCVFRWDGDGQPAFAAAEGVTFDPATALKIGAKYKLAGVIHKSENVWAPVGCLVA